MLLGESKPELPTPAPTLHHYDTLREIRRLEQRCSSVKHRISREEFVQLIENETDDTVVIGMTNATNKVISMGNHLQRPQLHLEICLHLFQMLSHT